MRFTYDGELVLLHLGERTAEGWRKAITTPSRDLGAKLDLISDRQAFLIGAPLVNELRDALAGVQAPEIHYATMIIAVVSTLPDLSKALNAHSQAPHLPIWIVCRKGKEASVGSGDIRKALRSALFRDTKICSVSSEWTATRYISIGVPKSP